MSFVYRDHRLPFTLTQYVDMIEVTDAQGRFVADFEITSDKKCDRYLRVEGLNAEFEETLKNFAIDPLVGHPAHWCSPELRDVFEWIAQLAGDPTEEEAAELLARGLIMPWSDGEYRIAPEHAAAWEAWLHHTYPPNRAARPAA